jgi:hypothetical protein
MTIKTLSHKDPAEQVPITFDFSDLVTVIDSAEATTATVYTGIDASPGAMISGVPFIAGALIIQQVVGGIDGVSYKLRATIVSGSEKYVLTCILPVVTD